MSSEPSITVEEIRVLVEQGAESGVVEDTEHELVEGVFQLGDRTVRDVMTPRISIDWIDLAEPREHIRGQVAAQTRSRFIFCEGTAEHVLGVACAEDLLAQCLAGRPFDIRAVMRQGFSVPSTVGALDLLERFRTTGQQLAVVSDDHGGMLGVVLPDNLLDEMVANIDAGGHGRTTRSVCMRIVTAYCSAATFKGRTCEAHFPRY